MTIELKSITDSIVKGDLAEATKLVEQAVEEGVSPDEIVTKGLIVGMETVGEKWKCDEMFLPEVLRSASTMSKAMDIVRKDLSESVTNMSGTMVIGTVEGDLHDIGKDLAAMIFEGAGYHVVNIGIDQPNEKFVEAVKEHKPELLGISALLTTTMPRMGEVINSLKEAGIRDEVTVVIGGAPVTQEFADSIGADIYAPNARSGVDRAQAYFKNKS